VDAEVSGVEWCVQLVKYLGYFPNRETAELYVKVLKQIKERGGV